MERGTGDLDSETSLFVLKILIFGVTPTISAMGIVGNCFSVAVLVKQGFRKSSNILLVVLAISDIVYLVSFNNERLIIYHIFYIREFSGMSEHKNRNLIFFFCVFSYLDYAAGTISFTVPMLITIERLVAVFLPLSFHRIITPSRTWKPVLIMCWLWLSVIVYPTFWFDLRFVTNSHNKSTVVIEQRSGFEQDSIREVLENVLLYFAMIISPILTTSGCLAISFKLRIESTKRSKMISKEASSNRTTKTLLAVCGVYVVTAAIMFLPVCLPEYIVSTSFTDSNPSNMSKVMYQIINIFGCLNSSCNFIVYVGLNKRFRDIYRELFCCLYTARGVK